MRGGLLLGAMLLLGCGSEPGVDGGGTCGDGFGRVQAGQGGSRLRALPVTGGELPIVRGTQGGIHVLVGFRVWDMQLDMRATYRLVEVGTGALVGTPTELNLTPSLFTSDASSRLRNPDLLILNNTAAPVSEFAGRVVRFEVEAVSADAHACDVRTVTLAAPP